VRSVGVRGWQAQGALVSGKPSWAKDVVPGNNGGGEKNAQREKRHRQEFLCYLKAKRQLEAGANG